jgi:DNA-binding NarL/FixJ family response regulator
MAERSDVDAGLQLAARLSPRERQVIELAASGLTNQQIGLRLQISVHAVKFHLAATYQKLGAANRTQAAYLYLRSEPAPESQPISH